MIARINRLTMRAHIQNKEKKFLLLQQLVVGFDKTVLDLFFGSWTWYVQKLFFKTHRPLKIYSC